jgi:hypothetical protein
MSCDRIVTALDQGRKPSSKAQSLISLQADQAKWQGWAPDLGLPPGSGLRDFLLQKIRSLHVLSLPKCAKDL